MSSPGPCGTFLFVVYAAAENWEGFFDRLYWFARAAELWSDHKHAGEAVGARISTDHGFPSV